MIGEIWTYKATKPSDNMEKVRPVIISSSASCGKYDVRIEEKIAKEIGLNRESIIKTTKIYTGSKTKLGRKICELPYPIKEEFKKKYKEYQENIICNL